MKRLMLVLAVGVLLVAMIMATAIPAFSKGNPNDKENPDAEFTLNPDGSIERIEVQVQCAPGVGGCGPPGGGKDAKGGNSDAKGGEPGWDSNFDVCPGSGKNTQDC